MFTTEFEFGESGKNFIETGKRIKLQETILRLAASLKRTGFRSVDPK
jgi:hypothetical protein